MRVRTIEIYNYILEVHESVNLSRQVSEAVLKQFAEAFKRLKLTGQIVQPSGNQTLIRPEDRKDYADDFHYDEQQFVQQLSGKGWAQFGLNEAAVVLGYQHVVSPEVWYSAMPFLFELILRADKWVEPFGWLVSRLREEGKAQRLLEGCSSEFAQAIVMFLELINERLEEQHETATVAKRAVVLWKAKVR